MAPAFARFASFGWLAPLYSFDAITHRPSSPLDSRVWHDILLYKMTDDASLDAAEARKSQILKGLAEMALLSLLRDGPRYGLDILDGLRTEAGLALAEGTIYPLLHRLERAGLVVAEWKLDEPGARPRKYYALTDQGRAELKTLHNEWRRISTSLTQFLDRGTK